MKDQTEKYLKAALGITESLTSKKDSERVQRRFGLSVSYASPRSLAIIAATYARPDEHPSESAIRAFELLEYIAAGQDGLARGEGYAEGIAGLLKHKKGGPSPAVKWPEPPPIALNKKGEETIPIAKALERLIPETKGHERDKRFQAWYQNHYGKKPTMPAWRNEGFPVAIYEVAKSKLPNWWKKVLKRKRSEAGKKGNKVRASKKS